MYQSFLWICRVRSSCRHLLNDHSGGGHYIQTGHRWHVRIGGGFSATPKDWPSMGAVVEHQRQHSASDPDHAFPAYAVLPNRLLPTFDQAYAALINDLDQRGLLDETLVVAMGEMGRTPKANPSWGRGHWSTLFPAVLAGAGVHGGAVYGRSDKYASRVIDNPVTPEDLAATIYDRLGIGADVTLPDREGRPTPIVDGGQPIREIFG